VLKRTTIHDVFAEAGGSASATEDVDAATVADTDEATDSAAAPDEPESESTPDVADAEARPRPAWRRRLLVTGVLVAVIAGWTLAGFLGWQVKQHHDIAVASRDALAVAQQYAVLLTSVDNTKIDENFTQVIDGATGEFKDMYSQSAAQLRQLLIDNKAVSHGTVVDAAVKSASADTVDVLMYVDQSISNSVNPQPRIDRNRVTITMQKINGRWLAAKVDIK
jgi:Mce-associated membrane protein